VSTDRRAGGLANHPETVGNRNTCSDLKTFAGTGSVGKAVAKGLFEAPELILAAEGKLFVWADQAQVVGRWGKLWGEFGCWSRNSCHGVSRLEVMVGILTRSVDDWERRRANYPG
jgi:hypothetical protein